MIRTTRHDPLCLCSVHGVEPLQSMEHFGYRQQVTVAVEFNSYCGSLDTMAETVADLVASL